MRAYLLATALTFAFGAGVAAPSIAAPKSNRDNYSDAFALVTPDSLLGSTTRRQWLKLWPVPGREYWAAWDCKGMPCDTPQRKHIRATAKLIARTDEDPKPITGASSSSSQ